MLKSPVSVVGNIASDIDRKVLDNGNSMAKFQFATTERVKVNDQWQDTDPVFHDVAVFGKSAEAAARTFEKGDRVAVIGELQVKSFVDKDGKTQQGTQIVAQTVAADPLFRDVQIDRTPRQDVTVDAGVTQAQAGVQQVVQEYPSQSVAGYGMSPGDGGFQGYQAPQSQAGAGIY